MKMKFLVAGATGSIGSKFVQFLHSNGQEVYTLTRNPEKAQKLFPFAIGNFHWKDNWDSVLPQTSAILNLSGASIGKRWTKKYKQEIYESRIVTTREIVGKLNNFTQNSITFFSTSAIGYYPDSGEEIVDEETKAGESFLAKVCVEWENEAYKLKSPHRLVVGRFGVVLKKDDLALQRILLSYRFGFGVVIGTGEQWFSWIHIEDLLNLLYTSITNEKFEGIYNFVSPNPVKFREFIREIGKILNKPFMLSVPDYLIKLAFGEQSQVLLASQRVIPKKLLDIGYQFKYSEIEKALLDIIG
ncbi:MAG: TIGR01777 family oxidoreductase [Candidatus Kapaibacteriota bacterium]|jgi:uncharacterized protein (TIGR01777 family)